MKEFFISLFLLISIIASSNGQDVKVTSSFDSTRIFVGDQIKYTVTVEKPSGLRLNIPVLKDTICKNIEIVSGPKTDSTVSRNGRISIIQKYLVTSFDSGRYQVKPVVAEAKSAAGLKRFYSDYSILEVLRVKIAPADTTLKIYDIVQPYKAPVTIGEILPWVLVLILASVAAWALIRYFRNRKKDVSSEDIFIPADPAHVIAFRELEILKSQELWQKGETKKYYTRLTEILRQYLENRFRVYSLELTTSETLEALIKTGFKKNGSYNELKSVLTGADFVKFAKHNPDAAENEVHFQTSWRFIETTKQGEMPSEEIELKAGDKEAVE